MKQREGPLELDKNLGKTMVVQNTSGRGPGVPGFYCETCNRTYKDSIGYLDHINGRARKPLPLHPCGRIELILRERPPRAWSDNTNRAIDS